MAKELKELRLRVNMTETDSLGKKRNRGRTFSNIATAAEDNHLYVAGTAVAGLLVGDLEGVYRIQEDKLTQ